MPKITLVYNMPEERSEYMTAIHGEDWKLICYEMANYLRDKTKYGHTFKTVEEALERTRKFFWDTCAECKLDPYED